MTSKSCLPFQALGSDWSVQQGRRVVNVVNGRLKLTPTRSAKDELLGRLGAQIFCRYASPGARLNIGTGLPEEVGAAVANAGITPLIEPFNEGGALGGLSAFGTFFGSAICPKELVSSAEVYRRVYTKLDCVVVGGLEVDETGSVNVCARSSPLGYVGPGGFVDLTCAAQLVIFAVAFETGAKLAISTADGGSVSVTAHGKPKFLKSVREVNFSGPRALQEGKTVYYVTHLGSFKLTHDGVLVRAAGPFGRSGSERWAHARRALSCGVQLDSVFHGVDVEKDIIQASPMKIVLPEGGVEAVKVLRGPSVACTNPAVFAASLEQLLKSDRGYEPSYGENVESEPAGDEEEKI